MRSSVLNSHLISGSFDSISRELDESLHEFESVLQNVLQIDWQCLAKIQNSLWHKPTSIVSEKKILFGKELVKVARQCHGQGIITSIVQQSVFGEHFCKLNKNELIAESKDEVVIYIASARQMQELFTLSNVCASQLSAHDMKYMACG